MNKLIMMRLVLFVILFMVNYMVMADNPGSFSKRIKYTSKDVMSIRRGHHANPISGKKNVTQKSNTPFQTNIKISGADDAEIVTGNKSGKSTSRKNSVVLEKQ